MRTENTVPHGLVLQTTDPEEAAACLRESAVPYVSELLPGSPPFHTQIFVTPGQRVSVSRAVTRGAMKIRAMLPEDSYAVVLDLRTGVGVHKVDGESVMVGPEFALVQSPLQGAEILTEADFEVLFVRISKQAMMDELQGLMGQPARSDLMFSAALSMTNAGGLMLRQVCDELRRTLYTTDQQNVRESAPLQQLESQFITLLLQAQPHNYRRFLNRSSAAGHWQLNTAEEYMRANAHNPVSLGDVCEAVGVNARTLQDSFRKKRGCTPMEFLRAVRMERVRAGLSEPSEDTSVAREAARWGFLHFGRFSSEYRAKFGELPSQTLRQARQKE
jgi:AraC-like DNA-binding protein